MKNYKHVYLLAVVLLSAEIAAHEVSAAQSQTPTDAKAGVSAPVQAGQTSANGGSAAKLDSSTALVAEFTQSLNSKNAKLGATVKAKVTQDVIAHGRVVVRRDSKLIGHITEVQASNKDVSGRLGIVFDRLALKGGGELELRGLIQAMAAPLPLSGPGPELMAPPVVGVNYTGNTAQPMGSPSSTSTRTNQGNTVTNSHGNDSGNRNVAAATTPANERVPVVGPGGALSIGAHGVIGMPGLSLMHGPSGGANASVVISRRDNVKLETGTQIVIQVDGTP